MSSASLGSILGQNEIAAPATPAVSAEYTRYFDIVKKNPVDFSTWTLLLKACDTEQYSAIATAFDAFLREYPFCYGYWKKYADHTQRQASATHLGPEPVIALYERAVAAVRYSVDMWGHYCNFVASLKDEHGSRDAVRAVYKRALEAVGSLPRSNSNKTNQLWNSLLRYEMEVAQDVRQVAKVYHLLLQTPFNGFGAFLVRYEEWAKSPLANFDSPEGAVSDDELSTLKQGLALPDGFEQQSRAEQILHCVRVRHQAVAAVAAARTPYETPLGYYFHVKPLSDAELKGWRAYLAFEQAQERAAQPHEAAYAKVRTERLFERAVIRCANYPDIWLEYANYKAATGASVEEVLSVYRRCTDVHLKLQPAPRLACAEYLESCGRVEDARAEYGVVAQQYPALVQGALASSNFERRHGNVTRSQEIIESALAACLPASGDARSPDSAAFLAVHLSKIHRNIHNNPDAARATFEKYLPSLSANSDFVAAYVAFELAQKGASCGAGQGIDGIIANLVSSNSKVPASLRKSLWRRRVELAEDFGTGYDLPALQALRKQRDAALAAIDGLGESSTGPDKRSINAQGGLAKKSRIANGAATAPQSAVQATHHGQAQAQQQQQPAAYGQQAQDPAVAAQWAAYYAQQAAYGQQHAAGAVAYGQHAAYGRY